MERIERTLEDTFRMEKMCRKNCINVDINIKKFLYLQTIKCLTNKLEL